MNLFPSPAITFVSHVMLCGSLAGLAYAFRTRLANLMRPFSDAETSVSRDLALVAVASGGAVLSILVFIGLPTIVGVAGAGAAAVLVPLFVRSGRRERYVRAFDGALAESLATVSASLRAGLTLRDSLEVAVDSASPIFAAEVALALKEYRFGLPIEQALDNVRRRIPTANCNIAFGAMIISSRLGGRLPEVLREIVTTIRERERVEGKLKALTAQGRAQAAILIAAPPLMGLGMALYDSSKMALLTDEPVGQILLTIAIVLEVVGIVVTRKVMKLEV